MLRFLFQMILGSRRPIVSGELTVAGLSRPVVIRRDRYGVPHIDAETDDDAAFALGFVQAQDRSAQLETSLRLVRGMLAELVGAAALPADRLTRRLGFRRAAVQQLAIVEDDVRKFLTAFAQGINAGNEHGAKQWAHEFALLKAVPTAWDAADVLAYVKFMSFQLPSNWDVELARFIMLRHDGAEAVAALDPSTPAMKQLLAELQSLNSYAARGGGSNNWVVAGSRAAGGKPVMGSDPHLGPTQPNPWYLAHLRTPGWSVAGATFAGTPVFPIAHNGFACWSVTAGLTDNTDLFVETMSEDGRRCQQPDGTWLDCEIVREMIAVKNAAEVIEEITITPRGPIVSPLIPGETLALSMQAVWLKPRPMRGFFEAAKARSFDSFRSAFNAWPVLPLNVLYADETGTIGYQLAGELPVRSGGNGLMPTPVSHGDWAGYVPFAAMPFSVNPECGYFATANDDPLIHHRSSAFLGADYCDPYRAETIREELAQRSDWSVAAFQSLQLNVRSKPWSELREAILALPATEADAILALDELRGWDGHVEADSSAAAVFEVFLAAMSRRIAQAMSPSCWQLALGGDGTGPFASSLLADRRVKHLVQLILTQPAVWEKELLAALAEAVAQLKAKAGPSAPFWAWGHQRLLRLRHTLLGKHWLLARVFNIGPIPIGGDMNTIAQAGVRPLTPFEETHNFPNLRCAFDTGNWSHCRFALAGGQSGNPCSANFDDQFALWQRGEGIPMPWTGDEVIKAAVASLQLKPGVPA